MAASLPASAFALFGEAPEWAFAAARAATPDNAAGAPAVVLMRGMTAKIDRNGSITRTQRIAIRILADAGRTWAALAAPYIEGSSRVQAASAWLIRNGREARRSNRNDWFDLTNDTYGALYSDSRSRGTSFAAEAALGDVFVAEIATTGDMLFAEDAYGWGLHGLPVVEESYRIELPPGFTPIAFVQGHPLPIRQQSADRRITTWISANRPFLPDEPSSPPWGGVHPLLFVRIEPPAGARFKPEVLRRWSDISEWTHRLNAGQCDRDENLIEAARRLTSGLETDLDKIRALGRYVQTLRYATLLRGLGEGLGVRPHKATQVLAQRYGDCKDKANLLCALLREVGIEADIAAASINDGYEVSAEFPSMMQFNHAIAAIRVGRDIALPAVVEGPEGRLLFFDPTSESTVVGDLPIQLQGTHVFVQRTGTDALTPLPVIPSEIGHRLVRRARLALGQRGSCEGTIRVEAVGQAGASLRHAQYLAVTNEALAQLAREQLGESFRAAALTALERTDDIRTGVATLGFSLHKDRCLQPLQNSLSVLRIEVFGRGDLPPVTAPERRLPLRLRPLVLDDEVEFKLPEDMRVHEVPASITLKSDFGTYARTFNVREGEVRLVRRLETANRVVPTGDYAALRKFLLEVGRADRASIVLGPAE